LAFLAVQEFDGGFLMQDLYLVLAAFLVLNIVAGLVRIVRGPTPADRMLAAQLFGTTGVAMLLLLAEAQQMPVLRDVALVFALLAALSVIAFVRRVWYRAERESGP
jgi:multicomponent Na+:H+ antiporter subunit F